MGFMAEFLMDIVVCINRNGSSTIMDELNNKAELFYSIFDKATESTGVGFGHPRIKILEYGNAAGNCDIIMESPFFLLPEQNQEFKAYVETISTTNHPQSGSMFEAIITAFNSDWRSNKKRPGSWDKYRNVIVVLDGSKPLPIGSAIENSRFSFEMPSSIDEMIKLLGNTNGKITNIRDFRLMLFVPQDEQFEKFEYLKGCLISYLPDSLECVDIQTVIDYTIAMC